MNKKYLLFLGVLSLVFVSCKSKQAIVQKQVENKPLLELIDKTEMAQPQFNTVNVSKMSMALNIDGRAFSVSASCKIKRDSVMHLSVQPIAGFEMFKVEITPDSIFAFDKVNRKMYVADFSYIERRFGVAVDFYSLQALISNHFFTIGTRTPAKEQCKLITTDQTSNGLSYETESMLQTVNINEQFRVEKVDLNSKKTNYIMSVLYTDFMLIDNVTFPQKIKIRATNPKHNLNCDFSISKALFNNKIVFSSVEPGKYERADINQLLKK